MQQLNQSSVDYLPPETRAVSLTTAAYAIAGALVTLAGWAFDMRRLTDWRGDGLSMFVNPALCVLMSGIALICLVSGKRRSWQQLVQQRGCAASSE